MLLAFSPEFLPAVPALEALLFGASIYSLFFLLVVSMMAVGKPFRAFSIALAVLALQFLLTFFLAPLGLFGIAAALSISLLAGFFLALLVFQKTAGFLPDFGKAFKTLACGLLVFAVSKALAFEGIGLFFEFLIAACLFALLLHLLKVFSINDWKHALRLLGNQP
ncbi:MAG TPA: hypothetical protein HA227_04640 [Candidatus Diapherotrites archaeon]|uniref:Polysaccharide biosynthesis protein C-terminal domain-containing protein n=1 Tax=Candidatus Iainarchaeum sp. TaxID=3101447 RepID=A0A7J4KWM1_9ARCH|nr:hypothetical protein [Candidatus Diapherotrites archaeon]